MYFSKSNLTNYTVVWCEPLSPLKVTVNRQRHLSEVYDGYSSLLELSGVTYIFLSCDRPLNAPVASSTERSLLLRRLRRSQSREQTWGGRSTNIISGAASFGMCVFVCIHAVWVHMSTWISVKCTACVWLYSINTADPTGTDPATVHSFLTAASPKIDYKCVYWKQTDIWARPISSADIS